MTQIKRKRFLGIPIDIAEPETVYKMLEDFFQDGKPHHVLLLTTDKILKARMDREYYRCIQEASLILPVSRAIAGGFRFLTREQLCRYNPYELIINVFMILEKLDKTVYLLGSRKDDLMEAEKNLKVSFRKLKVIGRFAGYFNRDQEKNIILAIKKSSPALLVAGKGLPGNEKWILRNKKDLNPGVYIWIDNYFEIFSGTEKSISKQLFKLGLESLSGLARKPWKVLRIFPYLYFKSLVLMHKIMGY